VFLAACLFAPGSWAFADLAPDSGGEVPDSGGTSPDAKIPEDSGTSNPLPGIIDLMHEVEVMLAEAETDQWTQAEQKRIVDALDLGAEAVGALQKLIAKIESAPP
jgi:hypothetical protein